MLLDLICKLLARTKHATPLALRLHTILCNRILKERGGLYLPLYGLILVEDKPYIWEAHNLTSSHAFMTRVSKRRLRQRGGSGVSKRNTEENPQLESLEKSIKAKLYMLVLLLLLLLTSLTEEWLSRKFKEVLPTLPFNMKVSTFQSEKQTTRNQSDGSQPLLDHLSKD